MSLWYFAHPYTVKDKYGNYSLAAETANFNLCCWRSGQLFLRGYNVYSPVAHTHSIHVATPEFLANEVHNMWYEMDEEFIRNTDFAGIILAPGWQRSDGCKKERALFEDLGREIRFFEAVMQEPVCLQDKL